RDFVARCRADGKRIVLPRITPPPRHLELHEVADDRHLVAGVWDIPEPDPKRCPTVRFADVDLALVPALAVDRAGYRLGYGAGFGPTRAVVSVGDDPASKVYVRNKALAAEAIGMRSHVHAMAASVTQAQLVAFVRNLDCDDAIHGVLVQLPLPRHVDSRAVI